jgi:eukaryotic-like serine/threonine-protein kinase
LHIYKGHTKGVYAVAWSHDGTRIASVAWDKTVQVWQAG